MPPQVPGPELSSEPRIGVPAMVGRAELTGGSATTARLGALTAATVPSGLLALTTRWISSPSSAGVSVYAPPVAPVMSVHVCPPPAERCHCSV